MKFAVDAMKRIGIARWDFLGACCLDIYRGLMVAAMIIADTPGATSMPTGPSCTPSGTVEHQRISSFLRFSCVGISLVYAFDARRQRGESNQQILWQAFKCA
jgi:predicted acyltransferase